MADVRHWRDVVCTNGYEHLGDFVLPEAARWECYTPMQERLGILAPKYAGDADAEAVRDTSEQIGRGGGGFTAGRSASSSGSARGAAASF